MTQKIVLQRFILLVVAIWVAGCSSLASLASYSVTNKELEQALDKGIVALHQQASLAGIPVELNVDDLSVKIGPDNRQVVQLLADATATITLLGLSYPASVKLDLEGMPYYDEKKKAVFLRSVKLNDSTVDAMGYRGNLAPLSDKFMGLINGYLANQPVYELKPTSSALSWLTSRPVSLSVEPGKLTFQPQ